jgi:hypothetical protein
MDRRRISYLLWFLFLGFAPVARFLDSELSAQIVPPVWVFALWAIPLAVFARIQNPFTRVVGFAWIAWALVGSVNVIGSYLFYGDFYLVDATPPALIYLLFTTVFFLGILAHERSRARAFEIAAPAPTDVMNPWMTVVMLAFPFLWFASVYKTLGYIPVLLKTDITQDMYEIDYGPLYGYALFLVISMLVAVDRLRSVENKRSKWFFAVLVAFFGACSMIDSKRVIVMLFMGALVAYLLRTRGTKTLRAGAIALVAAATVGIYIGGQIVRNGVDSEFFSNGAVQISTVGVEYRDFAYSVNNFEPGKIPNYEWGTSAIASMGNSTLLDSMGVDKNKLVEKGSAYAWRDLLGIDLGIRTGIVCEVYFAYGYLGLLVIFAFGWLTSWVSAKVATARTKYGLIFVSVVYALLLLSIVGQTMATTGSLTVLFYGWVMYLFLRRVSRVVGAPEHELAGNEHADGEQAGHG